MNRVRRVLSVLLLVAFAPQRTTAQALTSIASLRVGYNTRKVTANPTGELKARLDTVDRELASATQAGRTGEIRRLLAKGNVLLAGRAWTDTSDFNNSLVLRSDRVVVESQKRYTVRLEQLYAPSITLAHSLTSRAFLLSRAPGAPANQPATRKALGQFEGVNRDLRESPSFMEFDFHDVADGRYVLSVEVHDAVDSTVTLGTASLGIALKKGIDDVVSKLEAEANRAPQALRAEILYPVDRMRNVNRGRLELRTMDVDKDFAAAEATLALLKTTKDPFAGRTGDIKRHYLLEGANEVMQYRLYVPTKYSSTAGAPLIIALHGLGGTEDSFFDSYGKKLPELAEQHGYIIAAPLGYRVDGGYGWGIGNAPADATIRKSQELSERDVMQVLAQVRAQYKVDANRIYLMGHSMGAIGTWKMAPKYPEIWAAIGMFSGAGVPATLEKIKHIPEFVVHGDADATVNVRGSRTMVDAMKNLGIEVTYIEVPGGSHSSVVEPNLAAMMQFFDAHKKGATKSMDRQ